MPRLAYRSGGVDWSSRLVDYQPNLDSFLYEGHTRIRQDKSRRPLPESAFIVPLSVQELPNQRFTAWHVRVHFDPCRPDRLEVTFGNLLLDTAEETRVELFSPLVLLSLSCVEAVLWVSVHEIALG